MSVVIVVVVVVLGRLIMSVIVVLGMGCRSMEARAIMAIFLEDWEKSREEEGEEALDFIDKLSKTLSHGTSIRLPLVLVLVLVLLARRQIWREEELGLGLKALV